MNIEVFKQILAQITQLLDLNDPEQSITFDILSKLVQAMSALTDEDRILRYNELLALSQSWFSMVSVLPGPTEQDMGINSYWQTLYETPELPGVKIYTGRAGIGLQDVSSGSIIAINPGQIPFVVALLASIPEFAAVLAQMFAPPT